MEVYLSVMNPYSPCVSFVYVCMYFTEYSTIFPTFKLHLAAAFCIAILLRDKFTDDVMMT